MKTAKLRMLLVGVLLALAGSALAEVPATGADAPKDAKSATHAGKHAKDKDATAKKQPVAQPRHAAKKRATKAGGSAQKSNKGAEGP